MKSVMLVSGIFLVAVGLVLFAIGGESTSDYRKSRGTGIVYPVTKEQEHKGERPFLAAAVLSGVGLVLVLIGSGRRR